MADSTQTNTRKGVRKMTSVAVHSTQTFMEALRHFSAKYIADKTTASQRTVEAWKQGKAAPQGRHVLAMLSDDELCERLLKAAGRADRAHTEATITALRKALTMVEGK